MRGCNSKCIIKKLRRVRINLSKELIETNNEDPWGIIRKIILVKVKHEAIVNSVLNNNGDESMNQIDTTRTIL